MHRRLSSTLKIVDLQGEVERTMISQAILITTLMLLVAGRYSQPLAIPNCPPTCGDLRIPFPFGTSSECSLDDSFLITCNHSYDPPKPFLNLGNLVVLNISLDGLMKVASSVASDCYDGAGSQVKSTISELTSSKFLISSRLNKFTAVGCDTYALVQGSTEWKQMSAGCVSWCDRTDRVVNGTCSGIGCCQTSIPDGVRDYSVKIQSIKNHTVVNSFSACGYAFVVETRSFNFSSLDLKNFQNRKFVPVVLDWSVGYLNCREARINNYSRFACYANSDCSDSSSGVGYLCKCATGFQGNPYSSDGCQDIDECIDSKLCEGSCVNLVGSYSCPCPLGYEGDGKKGGEGCHSKKTYSGSIFFYVASGLMVPAIGSSWIFWRRKQKKVDGLRRNLFIRNGGLIALGKIHIFGAEDLKKATNNYDENNVVSGSVEHFGGVMYRAVSPEGLPITVVKLNAIEEYNVEVFINKLVFLSKLHHRNIVELLGCCLETQVPLLVFEGFVNRSLHDYIHDNNHACDLSWVVRLRIASETARVLEYLHYHILVPMIHGHLSSSSIVLGSGFLVKMHDINLITYSDTSLIQPIFYDVAYLDPEYFLMNDLTVKSDVYSFGVILAEMLTGHMVFDRHRTQGQQFLRQYFMNSADNLVDILDRRLESDGMIDQLMQVAALAKRCLSLSPTSRPTMTEVADAIDVARGKISEPQTITPNLIQKRITRGVIRRNRSF